MTNEAIHKSYDPAFFQLLFEVEDKHFWFRSRNRTIAAWVELLTSELTTSFRVLEVGCGTGNVLRVLGQACPNGTVVGMDLFAEGLKYAKERTSVALVQGDMHHPPFAGQFDIIGLFDVLEHLPDDRQVLRDLKGMLREGGALLLTVPAHPRLWSYFDEASHHCRRYQPEELKHKLVETGYNVEYTTQYMMSVFPLVWVGRHLTSLRGRLFRRQSSASREELAIRELHPMPIVNEVLSQLLDIEGRWLERGHSLPLGTSLLAVATR
jgi:SAM-dependent methyltransferase